MSNIFKYSELKVFFNKAKEYGKVTSFEKMSGDKGIILRHDIDYDVNAAHRLFQLERECDVHSTLFFLTSCPTYNINSSKSRKMIREMSDDNFEIGLHFDPTLYPETAFEELEEKAVFEASIIEFITGKPVKTISTHNPSIHGKYPIFKNFRNAYDPVYFQAENYMSDSRMNFRDKIPFDFIAKAEQNWIQVLLHPIHYSENGGNYLSVISEFIDKYIDNLHEDSSVNSKYIKDLEGKSLREILYNQ